MNATASPRFGAHGIDSPQKLVDDLMMGRTFVLGLPLRRGLGSNCKSREHYDRDSAPE